MEFRNRWKCQNKWKINFSTKFEIGGSHTFPSNSKKKWKHYFSTIFEIGGSALFGGYGILKEISPVE